MWTLEHLAIITRVLSEENILKLKKINVHMENFSLTYVKSMKQIHI